MVQSCMALGRWLLFVWTFFVNFCVNEYLCCYQNRRNISNVLPGAGVSWYWWWADSQSGQHCQGKVPRQRSIRCRLLWHHGRQGCFCFWLLFLILRMPDRYVVSVFLDAGDRTTPRFPISVTDSAPASNNATMFGTFLKRCFKVSK